MTDTDCLSLSVDVIGHYLIHRRLREPCNLWYRGCIVDAIANVHCIGRYRSKLTAIYMP